MNKGEAVHGPATRAEVDEALTDVAAEVRDLVPGVMGEAIAYALSGEGKRMRGCLLLAAFRTCGGRGDARAVAAAVEVVHAYSLVHDDLPCMDDDDVRRGRPTVHRVYGVGVATRVGIAMIPLAARVAWRGAASLGLPGSRCGEIVERLMRASGGDGMVGGQLLDLDAEGRDVGLDELERIHRGKTGCLIDASVVIGGMAAGAPPAALAALEGFGARVGLAFQIADDVLDITATTAQLGKTAGRDLELRKSTYPALLGVEGAKHRAERLVDEATALLTGAGLGADELSELAQYSIRRTW